jgi:hypothetical protein
MLIGHLGAAYAAGARWRTIPVVWLLAATMGPDLARVVLAATGVDRWDLNLYSHLLPWSLLLVAAAALVAWMARRDATSAIVVGALVLSHIALDMLSGRKPLWVGGPMGLDVQRYQQLEFVIEAALLVIGWRLLRRAAPRALLARRSMLAALLIVEAAYLTRSLLQRPYATRCIEYPLQPCWIRRHDRPPTTWPAPDGARRPLGLAPPAAILPG